MTRPAWLDIPALPEDAADSAGFTDIPAWFLPLPGIGAALLATLAAASLATSVSGISVLALTLVFGIVVALLGLLPKDLKAANAAAESLLLPSSVVLLIAHIVLPTGPLTSVTSAWWIIMAMGLFSFGCGFRSCRLTR